MSDEIAVESGSSRRAILKGAVGVGVGALAWSQPSIHGLARTPAGAQSSVNCMETNDFQWNSSANKFGWNSQPCAGGNNSSYTVSPTGGPSVCAGAWGIAQVVLTGDANAETVTVQVTTPGCYIVEITAFLTNGAPCSTFTAPNTTTTTHAMDMSCNLAEQANTRLTIEVDCDGGLCV